uniref:Uncharacterized protein n=1 Tax=Panagrolaimus superbus TaxID=310955 RepID=A0A914Y888_9BILA
MDHRRNIKVTDDDDDGWGPVVSSQSSNYSQDSNKSSRGSSRYSSPPRKSILKKRHASTQRSPQCHDCIPVSNVTDLTCADPTTRRLDYSSVARTSDFDKIPTTNEYINPPRERFYRSRCGTICKKLTPHYRRQNVKKDTSSSKSSRGKKFVQPSSQTPEILVKVSPENYKLGLQIGLFDDSQRVTPTNLLPEFLKCDDSKNDVGSGECADSENENDFQSNNSSGYGTQNDRFKSPPFDYKPAHNSSPNFSKLQQNVPSRMSSNFEDSSNGFMQIPRDCQYSRSSDTRRSHQKKIFESRPYY